MASLPRIVALVGAPSSEAAVFGRLLADRLRRRVVCVRTLLQLEQRHRTHAGAQIEAARAGGPAGLLPTQLVAPLVVQALQASVADGVVIAGYPRTMEQHRHLETMGLAPRTLVHLAVPPARQAHRFSTRHVCRACSLPLFAPEAAESGGAELVPMLLCDCEAPSAEREACDERDCADQRVAAYAAHTVPMLAALRQREGAVMDVEAQEEADATWLSIREALSLSG
jgi:adenylate kinase family enzyme